LPRSTSPDYVAIARRVTDAWSRGDAEEMTAYMDPDVEIDWRESRAPYAGLYHGGEGFRKLFGETQSAFSSMDIEVHEYVARGPHVAVLNTARLRGREGVEVSARSTIVNSFRGDKIVAIRLYQDHADALRAIGA
jgi:ketosteroid isomerase-like protein